MPPAVVYEGRDLRDLELCKRRNSRHRLVKTLAIHGDLSRDSALHQAHHRFRVCVHVVGRRKGWIHETKALTIFLVTIAAVRLVKVLALDKVLLEFWIGRTR